MKRTKSTGLLRSFSLLLLLLTCGSLWAQTDLTDPAIKEKFYIYGDAVDETEKTFGKSNADIWFSKYTQPHLGFVELKNGERKEGELVKRRRYNKASYKNITVDGQKKPDPAGEVFYEYHITSGGEKFTYHHSGVESYGLLYTLKEYDDANAFAEGEAIIDDESRQGFFRLINKEKNKYDGLNYGHLLYFAKTADDYVIPISVEEVQKLSLNQKTYYPFDKNLILPAEFENAFGPLAKKNKCDPWQPGSVMLDNGKVVEGKIALDRRKKKRLAFFQNKEQTLFLYDESENVGQIRVNGNTYISFENELLTIEELKARWKDKENLFSGSIFLEDGTEIKGQLAFRRDANLVKSYRLINGIYLIPESKANQVDLYTYKSNIDYAMVDGSKYVLLGKKFVEKASYLSELENQQSNKKEENLHPGYILLSDGTKREGRIAGGKYKIIFVDQNKEFQFYHAHQLDDINYYVQTIDGKMRKFIPSRKRPKIEGPKYTFVEVQSPEAHYSYYQNPFPTHKRSGVTKFVGGAISAGVEMGKESYAQDKAREAEKKEMARSGNEDRSKAAKKASYGRARSEADASIEVSTDESDGIFFEEWVIIDNKTDEITLVYKENEEKILGELLAQCPSYAQESEREQKLLLDANLMPKIIKYLNDCNP